MLIRIRIEHGTITPNTAVQRWTFCSRSFSVADGTSRRVTGLSEDFEETLGDLVLSVDMFVNVEPAVRNITIFGCRWRYKTERQDSFSAIRHSSYLISGRTVEESHYYNEHTAWFYIRYAHHAAHVCGKDTFSEAKYSSWQGHPQILEMWTTQTKPVMPAIMSNGLPADAKLR